MVEGRKQKQTKFLTQLLISYYCLVCIKIVPGQYFIEDILVKIPYQAYFINIIRKSEIEFSGIPLLPLVPSPMKNTVRIRCPMNTCKWTPLWWTHGEFSHLLLPAASFVVAVNGLIWTIIHRDGRVFHVNFV